MLKARLCKSCLDPEVDFNQQHFDDCKLRKDALKKKKSRYTCKFGRCSTHMWVCKFHKKENADAMKRFGDELRGQGLSLSLPAVVKTGFPKVPPKMKKNCDCSHGKKKEEDTVPTVTEVNNCSRNAQLDSGEGGRISRDILMISELAYETDDFRAMSMTLVILEHDTDVTSVHVHTSVHVIYNVIL